MWSPSHVAQTVIGLTIWAIWFVFLYGGLSVACAVAPPDAAVGAYNWLNASLLLLTLGTTVLLGVLSLRCWKASSHPPGKNPADNTSQSGKSGFSQAANHRFITRIAAGCHLLAAGATLAVGLPVLALPPCL
jgi:hypothetical protein